MTKYEWAAQEIKAATKKYPPTDCKYIDALLARLKEAGESLTRSKFFELLETCGPALGDSVDYMDYDVLHDHFSLCANFREAWEIPDVTPHPRIVTKAKYGQIKLPDDFCTLGGSPDWIQSEKFPICGECDADMILFLQLKSIPYRLTKENEELNAFTFGDAGNFYVFQCPKCWEYKTSSECH